MFRTSSRPMIILLASLLAICPWNHVSGFNTGGLIHHPPSVAKTQPIRQRMESLMLAAKKSKDDEVDQDSSEEWVAAEIAEVIQDNANNSEQEENDEWMPDREKAIRKKKRAQASQAAALADAKAKANAERSKKKTVTLEDPPVGGSRASPYTDEEEEVIRSMGGKTKQSASKREPGYLGDCTLQDIATDYSVPVCYIADVICMWGAPVPINVHDRLGDLVTGEQAFAMLEAVNSLDVSALNDRYSNQNLINVCGDYDIDLSEAFEMAIKGGWSLPFGVQTVLRVEQEEELLRVLGGLA